MIAGQRADRIQSSRGFALLIVLWFLVLIAAIGTYLMAKARSETAIARNIMAAARAEALADSGIALAVFNLTGNLPSNRWKLDGTAHHVLLPAGEMTIRLHDETGKINPNHASGALLSALFEAAGTDRFAASRLGAAVASWTGPVTEALQGAVKNEQYRNAGKDYAPPNAPIESIDELQLVIGMTPEILAPVWPYLTIHTKAVQPNGNTAPLLVRQALNLVSRESSGITAPKNNSLRNPSISSTGAVASANSDSAAIAGMSDERIVEIEVQALAADGGIFVRHAVLKIEPSNLKGYTVLDWRRGDLPH